MELWPDTAGELDRILGSVPQQQQQQQQRSKSKQSIQQIKQQHHARSDTDCDSPAHMQKYCAVVQTPQLCVLSNTSPEVLLMKLTELNAQLHTTQMQCNHLRAMQCALSTHVRYLENDCAAANYRADAAHERAALMTAAAHDHSSATGSSSSMDTTLPVLRGKALQSAKHQLKHVFAQLRTATQRLSDLQQRHTDKMKAAACEAHALREQLRQTCTQLAQRTVLYAAQTRAVREVCAISDTC